jgi:hypothetical protein
MQAVAVVQPIVAEHLVLAVQEVVAPPQMVPVTEHQEQQIPGVVAVAQIQILAQILHQEQVALAW